jgi:glycosyltransferase involved in cell wall biosynthesis
MAHLNANLFIVGSGDLKKELLEYTFKKKLINKIFFLGRVPFQQLKSITREFDLGLSFEEDTCLAYRYSLPNKIFDYIHAEIPILASDLPDISSLVINNKIGEVLSSRNPEEIASQIKYILNNKNKYTLNLKSAKKEFCWERQEKKIITLFNNL